MKIALIDPTTVCIDGLDAFCCEMLRQIRPSAEPGDDIAAQERIFPNLTGGRDGDADLEWQEFVHPDLQSLFESHLDRIEKDLSPLPEDPTEIDEVALEIPVSHMEAWIHGLNQARLSIAARHGFTEGDLDGDLPLEDGERALALVQVNFYGILQECFLRIAGAD